MKPRIQLPRSERCLRARPPVTRRRAVRSAAGLAVLALAMAPAQAQTLGCATGGSGGAIPASGTGGGGAYPSVLPTAPAVFTLNVASLPPGATVLTGVRMLGLTHTWLQDLQIVLTDPSGTSHNLLCRSNGDCDLSGDYTITPAGSALGALFPANCAGALPGGDYDQHFGREALAWNSGTHGILNTPLGAIPLQVGTWTLTIYDWAAFDVGALTSFELCSGTPEVLTHSGLRVWGTGGSVVDAGSGQCDWLGMGATDILSIGGAADSHSHDFGALDVGDQLPIGATMGVELVGQAQPSYSGSLGTMRLTKAALQSSSAYPYELTMDFSALGVTNGVAACYLDGVLQSSDAVNFSTWKGFLSDFWHDCEGAVVGGELTGGHPVGVLLGAAIATYLGHGQPAVQFKPQGLGGPSYLCDMVVLGYAAPGPLITGIDRTQITAQGFSAVSLTDLRIGHLGYEHAASGAVQWTSAPTSLRMSGLGNSGLIDGEWTITPSPGANIAGGARVNFAPLLSSAPAGASIRTQATGVMNGQSGAYLGDSKIVKQGPSSYLLTADYTAVGATSVLVEIYNGGVLQTSISGHTGPIATFSSWPWGCGKRWWGPPWPYLWCLWWEFGGALTINVLGPNGGAFVGDEIRILAEGSPGTLTELDSLGLEVHDLPSLTVTQIVGFPPPVSGPTTYCTAGTTTNGCNAAISASAQPSAALASPCVIQVANVEGQKQGLIFYGLGSHNSPWAAGSSSFLCVKSPTQRTGTQSAGGTNGQCDGAFTLDWNAYQAAHPGALGNPFAAGNKVYAQAWFRDPPAPKTTNLSDAIEMTYQP